MPYSLRNHRINKRPTGTHGEPTDESLLARIQARDDQAIAILYRRHKRLLRTIISRILHSDADVEDQIQEVFLEVWRLAAHYDAKRGKPLGWIVTLARRRSIDTVRKKQAYSRAQERLRLEPEPAPYQGTDEVVAASDTAKILTRAIATLPAAQRDALTSVFYGGLSQRELALRTGIPLGTIKTRLELALRKVRSAILLLGMTRELAHAEV